MHSHLSGVYTTELRYSYSIAVLFICFVCLYTNCKPSRTSEYYYLLGGALLPALAMDVEDSNGSSSPLENDIATEQYNQADDDVLAEATRKYTLSF